MDEVDEVQNKMRENKDIAEIIICFVPFVIVAKKYRKLGILVRSKMNVNIQIQ